METRLEQARASDIGLLRVALIDRNGLAVAYSPSVDELGRATVGKSFADRPYLSVLREFRRPMLSEVLPSRFSVSGSVVILLVPVLVDGEYRGAVGGVLDVDRIRAVLSNHVGHEGTRFTLVDEGGRVILTNRRDQQSMAPFSMGTGAFRPVHGRHRSSLPSVRQRPLGAEDGGDGIRQWIPKLSPGGSTVDLWGESIYTLESGLGSLAGWRLLIEQPVAPFRERLYAEYSGKLLVLFLILLLAVPVAAWVSRRATRALEALCLASGDLPARVVSGSSIEWPETRIAEIHNLTVNMRETGRLLREKVLEVGRMNEELERRVLERTEELQANQAFLEGVLGNIPDMIVVKDAVSLRFTAANRAAEESLGCGGSGLRGMTDHDVFDSEQAELLEAADRGTLSGEKGVDAVDERLRIPRLGERILHTRRIPIVGGDGAARYLLRISQDITEHRESEAALEEAYRQLEQSQRKTLRALDDLRKENRVREAKEAELQRVTMAIEQAGEIVFITDAEGAIQYANPAFEAVTGYSREEVLGQNPRILRSGVQDDAFYRELWGTISTGGVWKGRIVNRRRDGVFYTEDATISPVVNPQGQIVSYVAVKRDITRRLQLQAEFEQAQKMESVAQLAGGVAHDFNNLIMVIRGYSELICEQLPDDHPLTPDLDEIRKAAERGENLTRQLLAFARREAVTPERIDINDAVGAMLKMLHRLVGEDIALSWMPGVDTWPILMDRGQVDQLLANLCVNARDAIGGVGSITIATRNVTLDGSVCARHPNVRPGRYVVCQVTDDGCGMAEDVRARIFEPFFTTKGVGHGTGLGLCTVHGIVEQNGGFIEVESELGQGTTFRIHLPRLEDDDGARSAIADLAPERPGGDETVLLVEDEVGVRRSLARFLERAGYHVLVAESPDRGLQAVAECEGAVHLLVTDVVMPGMNGVELAERVTCLLPTVKVLFMSGYTADVISHRGVLDTDTPFLSKPFSRDALLRKVREVLDS
jgi:PAS domain S-box-containing protein